MIDISTETIRNRASMIRRGTLVIEIGHEADLLDALVSDRDMMSELYEAAVAELGQSRLILASQDRRMKEMVDPAKETTK
jgi:hypothetical protein